MEWKEFVNKIGMWNRYDSCCNCYMCEFVRDEWRKYQELGDAEYWKSNGGNPRMHN